MMPDNALSTETLRAPFQYPYNLAKRNLWDYDYGGIAMQDPSAGLQYQVWKCKWESTDSTVYIAPLASEDYEAVAVQSDVVEVAFTFDQNMRYQLALRLSDGTVKHHWYDPTISDYTVTVYTGIDSVAIKLDDKRNNATQGGFSDIILTYIKNNNLYFRLQRDRYLIQYLLYSGIPADRCISQFGMNNIWRMQWRISPKRINL